MGAMHYDQVRYTKQITSDIEMVINERDRISNRLIGMQFCSLKLYDSIVYNSIFTDLSEVQGKPDYRWNHESLRYAPAPDRFSATGYEDIGWSMVPMESLAHMFGIQVPFLSNLINKWNQFAGINYRNVGRTIPKLLGLDQSGLEFTYFDSIDNMPWSPKLRGGD